MLERRAGRDEEGGYREILGQGARSDEVSHTQDRMKCAAMAILARGDSCGLCEHWEMTAGWQGGAPAVGDCAREWEETMRMATAKPCPHFKRDKWVEEVAKTGHRQQAAEKGEAK